MPSPTACRARARSGVRAQSARKGAGVDRSLDLPPGTAACVKARARSRPRAARWISIPTRSSAATVKSRVPIRRSCLGRLMPPVSPCRSSDCLAWRASCRSRSTANRKSSSTRTAVAFPSPRSISPSPPEYQALTRTRFSRSQQGRLPCFQVDQGGDRLRGHAQSVTGDSPSLA